ncbi:CAP domain-containing protein [Russula brevipes]|nr:CAP domain-containing protein [Russula brevipes]
MLSLHNKFRQSHGANVLAWSDKLVAAAKAVADTCIFKHSGGPYGENLAAGSGNFTAADGFGLWTNEESEYKANNPTASHYTQVVWKSTLEVGCASMSGCSGIVPTDVATYWVCEYNPPGNVIGEFPYVLFVLFPL